ncbi:MAG: hypothetical protein ACRDL6_08950 [Solirubrobacterales bacterium]
MRAQQLRAPKERERLATAIDNLFRLTTIGPGAPVSISISPFDRYRVQANRRELTELAEKLRGDGPYGVRGLAMASLLIEDGHSPLYGHNRSDELKSAVKTANSAIDS